MMRRTKTCLEPRKVGRCWKFITGRDPLPLLGLSSDVVFTWFEACLTALRTGT